MQLLQESEEIQGPFLKTCFAKKFKFYEHLCKVTRLCLVKYRTIQGLFLSFNFNKSDKCFMLDLAIFTLSNEYMICTEDIHSKQMKDHSSNVLNLRSRECCTGITEGHGFYSRLSLIFFAGLLFSTA